jgi:hypothetical protein
MAWQTPKTNWGQAGQTVPIADDFNRIEGNTEYLKEQVDNKVDKVSGKGLSTNDYTDAEKNKLAGIEAGAQKNPTDYVPDSRTIAGLNLQSDISKTTLQDALELGLLKGFDLIIRTQAQFNAMIGSPNWLGAVSVALIGQFTLSTPNNSGVKIPATVKQIQGFNGAKITITNFRYNEITAKGGLWYDTAPTTADYSIRDLEVDCTDAWLGIGVGFYNCTNLTNCTGIGTGTGLGYGFYNCTNLTNCTGTGTGTGTGADGYGFRNCANLTNCTGTGTGTGLGYGFYNCTNLTNCTGTGSSSGTGYGFYNIINASNCKDGGSSTNMWGGTNRNIDIDTCRKTPVQITPTELTTLNT